MDKNTKYYPPRIQETSFRFMPVLCASDAWEESLNNPVSWETGNEDYGLE